MELRLTNARFAMKTRMRAAERQAAIVRSAIQLFAEKGFRGATTRELASALGVTEPVLYQHFRTKRDLYSAIIEAKARQATERVDRLRPYAESSDDRAFFVRLAELILKRYETDPEITRLLLYSSLERHELSELFFERVFADFYQLVSCYIGRRIRAGAFRKVDPEIAARALIGMISYSGLVDLLFPGRLGKRSRKRTAREKVEIFLHGIAAPVSEECEEPNVPKSQSRRPRAGNPPDPLPPIR
jgi:AcrR family transcriptional regulator